VPAFFSPGFYGTRSHLYRLLDRRRPDYPDRHRAVWRQRGRHCAGLPQPVTPEQRKTGIFWGVAGAVSLRVVLTVFAALVMNLPWLKLVGGLLLVWIAVKLMLPEEEDGHDIEASAIFGGSS
jgi:hypothetical protein